MKLKDLIKSPWYIFTLILCAVLACILLIVVTHNPEEQVNNMPDAKTPSSYLSLDYAMTHVCLVAGITPSEIMDFHISYNNGNSPALTYDITLTFDGHTYQYKAEQTENGEVIVSPTSPTENTLKDELPDDTSQITAPEEGSTSSEISTPAIEPEGNPSYHYVSTTKVKENVLLDSLLTEDDVDFVTIELNESEEVPFYEVVFETKDKYRKYIYKVNAFTGLLRSRTYYNADDIWDEGNIFMKHEGKNAKWYDEIWEKGIPDGKRGSQSFYNEPIYTEE